MTTFEPAPQVDPATFAAVTPGWIASNFGGMVVFGLVAARSRSRLMRTGFKLAALTHVVESAYAYRRAQQAGFTESAPRWALQTLAVGFPSLQALHRAIEAPDDLVIDLSERAPATS